MLENNKLNGVHYSRYIASWHMIGGNYYEGLFLDWLRSLGADDKVIADIREMANGGKFELEMNARSFVKAHRHEFEEES